MRSIYATIFLLFFAACSQSVTSPPGSGNAYIKFKVNGVQKEMFTNVGAVKLNGIQGSIKTSYTISGVPSQTNFLSFVLVTDSLQVRSYVLTNDNSHNVPVSLKTESLIYSNFRDQDILTINITRYSGGSIDGVFGGMLSNAKTVPNQGNTYTDGVITEGEFKNVQIIY